MSHHIVLIGEIRSSNCLPRYYRAYLPLSCVSTRETKRRDDCDVATGVNFGVASTSNWSMSICDREMGIRRIRGPPKTTKTTVVNVGKRLVAQGLELAWASCVCLFSSVSLDSVSESLSSMAGHITLLTLSPLSAHGGHWRNLELQVPSKLLF